MRYNIETERSKPIRIVRTPTPINVGWSDLIPNQPSTVAPTVARKAIITLPTLVPPNQLTKVSPIFPASLSIQTGCFTIISPVFCTEA